MQAVEVKLLLFNCMQVSVFPLKVVAQPCESHVVFRLQKEQEKFKDKKPRA
jgi:hypothetical protein